MEIKAPEIWTDESDDGNVVTTHMRVGLTDGSTLQFSQPVSIKAALDIATLKHAGAVGADTDVEQVAGFLSGIVKGLKKVAKVTGISAVIKTAGKVLSNPVIKAVVPGADAISSTLKGARSLVVAKAAATAKAPQAKGLLNLASAEVQKATQQYKNLATAAQKMTSGISKPVTPAPKPTPNKPPPPVKKLVIPPPNLAAVTYVPTSANRLAQAGAKPVTLATSVPTATIDQQAKQAILQTAAKIYRIAILPE